MKRFLVASLIVAAAGCTPGASAVSGAAGSGTAGHIVTVDVDLTNDPGGNTPGGAGAGYAPLVVTVSAGDGIRFTNSDGFAHTASSISGSSFPSAYPFTGAALDASGSVLSGGFSTGSLAAGATSQTFTADVAGTYLFGCFYHYGSPMRAAIVVR